MSATSIEDRLEMPLEVAAQHAAAVDRDGRFPQEAIGALADAGLLGLTVPETLGGLGDGPSEFLAATRRIAAVDPSTAMIYLMHTCAAQVSIAGGAPDGVVSGMAGAELTTLAFSERGSRSHFWAPVSHVQGANGDARLLSAGDRRSAPPELARS
jgi:alkylation response protein AidB-like acyl-CoA dehydrogenase